MLGRIRFGKTIAWVGAVLCLAALIYLIRGVSAKLITARQATALVVEKSILDFGTVRPDSSVDSEFRLVNHHDRPININGSQIACDCMTSTFVAPRLIAPGESFSIPFNLHFPEKSGRVERDIMLYTNNIEQRTLKLVVLAEVVPKDTKAKNESR